MGMMDEAKCHEKCDKVVDIRKITIGCNIWMSENGEKGDEVGVLNVYSRISLRNNSVSR
jgi:hypothetical protein